MQKRAVAVAVVVFALSAVPTSAVTREGRTPRPPSAISRFIVWLHSRLGPPLPAPVPDTLSETTENATRTADS